MKYRLIFIVLSLVLWVSCYDEDALTPTETSEFNYTLPQGNHDYDTKIVSWFDRCGFYILYKYDPRDVYWSIRHWLEPGVTELSGSKFKIEPADEEYVGGLLDVLERRFLNFYPDTLLQRCMPLKVLFGSNLKDDFYGKQNVRFGLDFMLLDGADKDFQLRPPHQIDLLKDTMNLSFMDYLTTREKVVKPEEFFEVSSYREESVSAEEMYSKGYIVTPYGKKNKNNDWNEYLKAIIKNPYTYLSAEPEDGDISFKGILHEKKDVKKLIVQKYNIIIQYFKQEYNIDLQKIGDSKEPARE